MRKKTKAVGVALREAEPARRYLRQRQLLRDDVLLKKDDTFIWFPVKDQVKDLPSSLKVTTKLFDRRTCAPHSYKDLLAIPKKYLELLPTSYDIVGTILLMKVPKSLFKYQKKIGKALLESHRNIQTVCAIDAVVGELRTRNVTIIAGKRQTKTTHTEHGLRFTVDVASTYFSPRLASERKRIAGLVQPEEVVVDLFAGVAPFSIMIARYAKPKVVYAVDKNKKATSLAEENVKQNRVLSSVEVIHADARDAQKLIPVKADRVIMNLPFSAYDFFPVALSIAAKESFIHYYDVLKEDDIDARISALKKIAEDHEYHITDVSVHKIKSYAPREFYIGVDITATKHADVA